MAKACHAHSGTFAWGKGCRGCEGCWATDLAVDLDLSGLWGSSAAGRFAGGESGQGGRAPGGVSGLVSSGEVSSVHIFGATVGSLRRWLTKVKKDLLVCGVTAHSESGQPSGQMAEEVCPEGRVFPVTLHTIYSLAMFIFLNISNGGQSDEGKHFKC